MVRHYKGHKHANILLRQQRSYGMGRHADIDRVAITGYVLLHAAYRRAYLDEHATIHPKIVG